MRKSILFLMAINILYAYDSTIVVEAPKTELTDNLIFEDDFHNSKNQTLDEKLKNDTSYISTKDSFNKDSISFRGIKTTATNVIEDLIPSYRTTGGNIDFYTNYNMYEISTNMMITPSSTGVSSMGSDIELHTKKPKKKFEGQINTIISLNDNEQKIYLGSLQKNYYVQFFTTRYDRDSYNLSNDFTTTLEQASKNRLNSDNRYNSFELKGGVNINDNHSLKLKVVQTKNRFGIEPNVYDNSALFSYARMNKKDLNSIYGYYDYINDQYKVNFRLYYDDYQDIYNIYNDNRYTTHWPTSLYDDSRFGALFKITANGNLLDEYSFVMKLDENKHIWNEEGRGHIPKFKYQDFSSSIIGKKEFDNITLNAAITYKSFKPLKVDYDGDPAFTQQQDGTKNRSLDYQLVLNYLLEETNLYYISHSKTTKVPSMSEMFSFFPWDVVNVDLNVESSTNYEIGYKRFLDYGLYSFSLFDYSVKDKILKNTNGKYANLDKAKHQGLEFRYDNRYFNKHNFKFSYSYIRAKDQNDKELELIPKNKLVIEDKINIDKIYSANIQYLYLSKRKDDTSSGTKELSSYSLVNLYLSANLSRDWDMAVGVKNLFDKNYSNAYGYPSEGRNIYGMVSWKF